MEIKGIKYVAPMFDGCYDDQTELLTYNGWKYFKDISDTDLICNLNKDGFIEYNIPSDIIVKDWDGDMYLFNSSHAKIDLFVTPDHNMYVQTENSNRKSKSYGWEFEKAEEIIGKFRYFKKDADYYRDDLESIGICEREIKSGIYTKRVVKTDDWLEFLGYYLSEGSSTITENPNHYIVQIRQLDEKNKLKMAKALERITVGKINIRNDRVIVNDKELSIYLKKKFGDKYSKYIPRYILNNCSKRQLSILFEALMLGDGHDNRVKGDGYDKGGSTYHTASLKLRDDLMELLLKIGYSGSYVCVKKKGEEIKIYDRVCVCKADNWCIQIKFKNNICGKNKNYKFLEEKRYYKGKVYCVSVPNHTLYVRRNGCCVWCGNSGYAQAARGNILSLHALGVPLTLNPISFEEARPDLGEDGQILKSLVNKDIDYNIVLIHTTPEFWHKFRETDRTNVGYTIWETSKLHPDWENYINDNVQKVLVGCEWNVGVFKESGVKIPIGVVPHGIGVDEFEGVKPYGISGITDDTYVFYSIFQWIERKHPIALIKSYWYAFQNDEKVALVLKTYRSNYSEPEKNAIRITVKKLKGVTPMAYHPKIYLILDMLSHEEMLGLHARGDCYVSLDRGEGFGLSPFAAGAAGNPIIVTGFGGVTEYAKEHNSYLVDYSLTPVHGMPWSSSIKSIIYTNDGFKNINKLKDGDLVFNKNNNIKKVIKVGSRALLDDETMYALNYMSMYENLEVTNFHKLYTVDGNKIRCKCVSDINVGDYLLVPKPQLIKLQKNVIDLTSYIDSDKYIEYNNKLVYKNNNSKKNSINRFINIDDKLASLIGFYLAEGCVYKNGSTTSFSFSGDELDTLVVECSRLIVDIFGLDEKALKLRIYKDRNGCELCVYNKFIARFFRKEFSTGSKYKKIPSKFCLCNKDSFRKSLLSSYWLGDGHVRKFRIVDNKKMFSRECVATSVSRELILNLRNLMLSLDILPSITMNVRKDGRVSYILSVNNQLFDEIIGIPKRSLNISDYHYYVYDKNNFAVRLKDKKALPGFDGDVWSISVEPDKDELKESGGSYILNGIASSNSPWYRGDQLWAEPDVLHGANFMRKVYDYPIEAKQKGALLQQEIRENFSWRAIGKKIIKELEEI